MKYRSIPLSYFLKHEQISPNLTNFTLTSYLHFVRLQVHLDDPHEYKSH